MQSTADANDVALRPHGKTHKCLALAREQMTHGAMGLTVVTLAEAGVPAGTHLPARSVQSAFDRAAFLRTQPQRRV